MRATAVLCAAAAARAAAPHRATHTLTARASPPPALGRRGLLAGAAAAALAPAAAKAASLTPLAPPTTRPAAGRAFGEAILPPVPFGRATYRYDLGRGAYAFEQLLRFRNVSATVRMTVQRLEGGGLWVNAPVAPTGECLSLLADLGAPVEHVVLPVTALEHKAFFGPFVRKFPSASVWVAPGQYGPFGAVGLDAASSSLPYRVDGVLPRSRRDPQPPWAGEIDTRTFYVDLPGNAGPVAEAAFFHKKTKTLFVTDAVSWIPKQRTAPDIFRTSFPDALVDDADFWPKSVLQAVFLSLRQAPDGSWPGYDKITDRVVRAPILAAFADIRAPAETAAWVDDVATSWQFDRIVTAHFASPFAASPKEFRRAFARNPNGLEAADWAQLDDLNRVIVDNDLGAVVKGDYH